VRHLLIPRMAQVVGLILALSVAVLAGCDAQPSARSTTIEQPPANVADAPLAPPISPDAAYRARVVGQIADALQQDSGQLAAALRADAQSTLMSLAKPLGVAQDRLAQIALTALDEAADAYGQAGTWSAQQVTAEKAYWGSRSQGPLISEVSRWLREV